MPKPKAVLSDLDGTLSDHRHRTHIIRDLKGGFVNNLDQYHAEAMKDPAHQWCRELLWAMHDRGYRIIVATGRPVKYFAETRQWICYQLNFASDEFDLHMCDSKQDIGKWKVDLYEQKIKPKYDVPFVLEDWQPVVDAWRAAGVVCLQPEVFE